MYSLSILVILFLVMGGGYATWRFRRRAEHDRRKREWRARRDEEDRIWYDKFGRD